MVLSKDVIQLVWPVELELLVHELLGSWDMADPGKTVLFFGVVHFVAIHLSAQPFTTVNANLNQKGKPALQPQVHEAELRMQLVEIEMLASAALELEFQFFGLAVAAQEISPAGLHTSKNPNQSLLQSVLFDKFPNQRFLARVTRGQITKRPSGYLSHPERGSLNPLG